MILVLLGTFDIEFRRPLLEIDKLCKEGLITEQVVVQNGHTYIDSKFMFLKPFIPPNELNELHEKARVIITHAGTGSLIKAISLRKKVIGIARLKRLGEHVDDHQLEILEKFAELNYIMPWRENDKLEHIFKAIDNFKPAPFVSNKPIIINYLVDYIESL